jgi:hypothetical protein
MWIAAYNDSSSRSRQPPLKRRKLDSSSHRASSSDTTSPRWPLPSSQRAVDPSSSGSGSAQASPELSRGLPQLQQSKGVRAANGSCSDTPESISKPPPLPKVKLEPREPDVSALLSTAKPALASSGTYRVTPVPRFVDKSVWVREQVSMLRKQVEKIGVKVTVSRVKLLYEVSTILQYKLNLTTPS